MNIKKKKGPKKHFVNYFQRYCTSHLTFIDDVSTPYNNDNEYCMYC